MAPRKTAPTLVLLMALSGLGIASCVEEDSDLIASPTATKVATTSAAPTTSLSPDPYSLDDLPHAHTSLAVADTKIFTNNGYSGDLIAAEFTCDALAQAASFTFTICAIGGTDERPFALVIGDEYVSRDQDTATTGLLYQLFQPVPHANGVRAVQVRDGHKTQELVSFDAYELSVRSVTAGVAGTAISLHYQLFGPSRTWNAVEMIGLNAYGSVDVVATFSGEGVEGFSDGRGFVFTNYHYGDNEGLCCPSYYAINSFRPGPSGWTHSVQTVPNDPDSELTAEQPFRTMKLPDLIAEYSFARANSND